MKKGTNKNVTKVDMFLQFFMAIYKEAAFFTQC